MNLSSRAKKRTLFVSLLATVLLAGVGGAYLVNETKMDADAKRWREEGMQAALEQRYSVALDRLGKYLQRFGTDQDPEAIHQYAIARLNNKLPNNKHILSGASMLQRVVDLDLQQVEAREQLLELYAVMEQNVEAIELADAILAEDSQNMTAMLAKAMAFQRMRQFDRALEIANQIAQVYPLDARGHFMVLSVMKDGDAPKQALIDYARKQVNEHNDQPQFALLLVRTLLADEDYDQAVAILESLAEQPPDDSAIVMDLVRRLDELGITLSRPELRVLAVETAQKAFEKTRDWGLRRWLVQNAWDVSDHQRVVDWGQVDVGEPDTLVQGLSAMSWIALDRADQAQAVLEQLQASDASEQAAHWAHVIGLMTQDRAQGDEALRKACRDALENDPGNPYFRCWLGELLVRLGETDEAIAEWTQVLRSRPAWWQPQVALMQALRSLGRIDEAQQVATRSRMANPAHPEVFVAWAQTLAQALAQTQAQPNQNLLTEVQRFLSQIPDDQRMRLLEIQLLVRLEERSHAKARATEMIQAGMASEAQWLQLAQISREASLGVEDQAMSAIQSQHGSTPAVVFTRALALLEAGDTEGGLAILDQAIDSDPTHASHLTLARARYLEAAGDPRALEAWRQVAQAYPDVVWVQSNLLDSAMAWQDLALINRAIDRVKQLTGEDGLAWRLARARWLLEKKQGQRDDAIAADILSSIVRENPENVQAYLLLAQAMEQLGNLAAAREQLNHASTLRPDDVNLVLNLATLCARLGDSAQAGQYLETALASRKLTLTQASQAASVAVALGRIPQAVKLLADLEHAGRATDQTRLLLANLYQQAGQVTQAERLIDQLSATRDLQVLTGVMRLLAAQGRVDDIRALAPALREASGSEVDRALAMALYDQALGSLADSVDRLVAATTAAPDDSRLAHALIQLLVQQEDWAGARAAADRYVQAVGDEAQPRMIREAVEIAARTQGSTLQQLALQVIDKPALAPPILEAMRLWDQAQNEGQASRALLVSELRRLADQNADNLTLQLLLAQTLGDVGNHEDMLGVAMRAMQTHPASRRASGLALAALVELQRWDEVVVVADQYIQRGGDRQQADLFAAQGLLQQGRPVRAVDRLEPYVAQAVEWGMEDIVLLGTYVRARIAAGQIQAVRDQLIPQVKQSQAARELWRTAGVVWAAQSPGPASDWLVELEAWIPDDAVEEQMRLIQAYRQVATSEARQRIPAMLEGLSRIASLDDNQLMILGALSEQSGDAVRAAQFYRASLAKSDNHQAANNLAMVLVREGKHLPEALQLAQNANRWHSAEPNYLDTVAAVYLAMNQPDHAVNALRDAVKLEAGNPAWWVNLADAQVQANQVNQAQQTLDQIRERFPFLATTHPQLGAKCEQIASQTPDARVEDAPTP